jgi:hypothetical protein
LHRHGPQNRFGNVRRQYQDLQIKKIILSMFNQSHCYYCKTDSSSHRGILPTLPTMIASGRHRMQPDMEKCGHKKTSALALRPALQSFTRLPVENSRHLAIDSRVIPAHSSRVLLSPCLEDVTACRSKSAFLACTHADCHTIVAARLLTLDSAFFLSSVMDTRIVRCNAVGLWLR